jgi:hypothetical protein
MQDLLARKNTQIIGFAIVSVGCAYLILLHASLGRPIWFDEFLQFAFAADTSSNQAWNDIRQSIHGVNHNQTGVYMMLDYWLEKAFGANATVLRVPSILCGCFFCYVLSGFFTS